MIALNNWRNTRRAKPHLFRVQRWVARGLWACIGRSQIGWGASIEQAYALWLAEVRAKDPHYDWRAYTQENPQ